MIRVLLSAIHSVLFGQPLFGFVDEIPVCPVYLKQPIFRADHKTCYFFVQVLWPICVSLIMAAVNRFVITCVTWKYSAAVGLVTTSLMTPKPALVSNEFLWRTSREGERLAKIQNKTIQTLPNDLFFSHWESVQQLLRAMITVLCVASNLLTCRSI